MPAIYRDKLFISLNSRRALLVRLAAQLAGRPPATFAAEATLARAREIVRAAGFDPDSLVDQEATAA